MERGIDPKDSLSEVVDQVRQLRAKPVPLIAFPAIERFAKRDPWLKHPDLRVECPWDFKGWGSHRYAFYLLRKTVGPTLVMVLRDGGHLHYCRLFQDYTRALLESVYWAREILAQPGRGLLDDGGVDMNGCRWQVRVVKRQKHWETHITYGGVIPFVSDFKTYEEATLLAEEWLTSLHFADDDDRAERSVWAFAR